MIVLAWRKNHTRSRGSLVALFYRDGILYFVLLSGRSCCIPSETQVLTLGLPVAVAILNIVTILVLPVSLGTRDRYGTF